MFRAILYTQWRWARVGLTAVALGAFVVPLLVVQGATGGEGTPLQVRTVLDTAAAYGVFFPVLAAAAGLIVGVSAWTADHATQHVYALTLPMPRWQFALYRYAAGLALLALPVLLVWVASLLAASLAELPGGLRAYPNLLALRFLLCVLIAYGAFFAISAGTARTAGKILAGLAGLVILALLFGAMDIKLDIIGPFLDAVFTWPGPLDIYTGRWMLIDV